MSDLTTLTKSVDKSRPVEVYEFTLGAEVFRYTSAEDELTIGADTYAPEALSRSKVVSGVDQARKGLQITLPATNELAARYKSGVPGESAIVRVLQYQRDEIPAFGTSILLFRGSILSAKFSRDVTVAVLNAVSDEGKRGASMPKHGFGGMCGNLVYDAVCGADPSLHQHTGAVTGVSGKTITIAGLGASGHDFRGGYCRPVGENDFRQIVTHAGDVVTIATAFASDISAATLQAVAGCDHLIGGDCAQVFDRVAEFLGFAFVPKDNIFETGLTV